MYLTQKQGYSKQSKFGTFSLQLNILHFTYYSENYMTREHSHNQNDNILN